MSYYDTCGFRVFQCLPQMDHLMLRIVFVTKALLSVGAAELLKPIGSSCVNVIGVLIREGSINYGIWLGNEFDVTAGAAVSSFFSLLHCFVKTLMILFHLLGASGIMEKKPFDLILT